MKYLSTTLFTVALMLLPIAVVAERQISSTWQSRLAIPKFEIEPNRHTPKYFAGTFLPPVIKEDVVLSEKDNPVLIMSKVYIESGARLTLDPGVRIYVSENAGLEVSGQLIAKGLPNKPIWFLSNETHPLNQTWLGISVASGGTAIIEQVIIEGATPAISCLGGSQVSVSGAKITKTIMGAFIASDDCLISNTVIRSLRDGIVVVGVNPTLFNNVITAKKDKVKRVDTKYEILDTKY